MRLTIHRGSHEIGGSCVEIKSRNSRIVIDIGVPIVTSSGKKFNIKDYKNLSTEELIALNILPNVKGLYKQDNINNIDGLLISHAHIDHYGLYNFVDKNIQYYLGEKTHRLIDLSNIFIEDRGTIKKHTYFNDSTPFQIGDFTITPYLMDHSAFDAYAFLIEADGKKLLYSGDFRAHGRKWKLFYKFLRTAPKDIDALLLEGTLIEGRPSNFKTEEAVKKEIMEILSNNESIVFCIASPQNIDRMVSFYKAAKNTGRFFAIDVYAANILAGMGKSSIPHPSKEYSEIRVFFPPHPCDQLKSKGRKDMMYKFAPYKITKDEISKNPDNVFMMVRPSVNSFIRGIKDIGASPVIYSMWEGYLKDPVIDKFIRTLTKGDNKLTHHIHTSGHASIKTLQKVADRLNPNKVIPIHTLNPKMYGTYFKNVVYVSDGQEIEI